MRRRLMLAAWALASLGLAMSLVCPWIGYRRLWWWGLFAISYPWWYLAQLPFALWHLVRRDRWSLAFSFGLLAIGAWHIPSYLGWHAGAEGSFRILSLNANYFGAPGTAPLHLEQVKPLLTQARPDVVCAQDFTTDTTANNNLVLAYMMNSLGLSHSASVNSIFSRFPVAEHRHQVFPHSFNTFGYADVTLDGRTVRVYNLHLQSYGLSLAGGWREAAKTVPRSLRRGLQMRPQQARLVADSLRSSPHPVIVCGDFNDVPTSYVYRVLSNGLRDGFRDAGRGLALTYRGPLPGLRIDYVFCSPELEFTRYRHLAGPAFLDHRWVLAELRWRRQ